MKTKKSFDVKKLALLAMFVAIVLVMSFTPLGYLKIGPLSITLLAIPVAVGSIVIGPWEGAFLGAVFGLTSFIQCFGMDWFGTTLCNINPILTFLMCMIPRVLLGLFSGLIYRWVAKIKKIPTVVPCAVSCLSAALINTVLFTGLLILFFATGIFGNSKDFYDVMLQNNVIASASVSAVIAALITVNAVAEAAVSLVVGAGISQAIFAVTKKKRI